MPSQRVHFENESGDRLAGIVDLPNIDLKSFAIFSHCFTCTKDLKGIVRISRGLARHGIGVLRFDFTGLGDSQGDFSQSNFESNQGDIRSAIAWVSENHMPPQILMGLSLGGAAMMSLAGQIESAKCLVTLASPSCTVHLADYLSRTNSEIESTGSGEVVIGGRTHLIRQQLLDSLRGFDLKAKIKSIELPHLIFHSPEDETLGYHHAEEIFAWTGGAKSLITLDGADHLIVKQAGDVGFIADVISLWANRYIHHVE